MTIRNLGSFIKNLWDWEFIDRVLGGKRKVTDLDGITEFNSHFLVIEVKSEGVEVNQGQMIMFEKMVKTGPYTVLFMWGPKNNPKYMQVLHETGRLTDKVPTTEKEVQEFVKRWEKYALENPL